jgi:hypothetical protein
MRFQGEYGRFVKKTAHWFLMAGLALDYGYLLARDFDATPYDDAYFFKRFALNFLGHGAFAWNSADGPVHGLTSQLFQCLSVVSTALARDHFVIASKILLTACLVAGAWVFADLAKRLVGRLDVVAGVTLLVFGCPLVAWTMQSGMETALTFLVAALSFRTILEPNPARHHALASACMSSLVYLSRPDAVLLPVVTFVVANARDRRKLFVYLGTLALLLGALLLGFRLYYGTALPLSFYVKTAGFSPYDEAVQELGVRDKLEHLATVAAFGAPLVFMSRPRRDVRALALVVASSSFVVYHGLMTTEIMGYRARFYAPALIPLGLAAALGAPASFEMRRNGKVAWLFAWALAILFAYGLGWVASGKSPALERIAIAAYLAHVAIAGWLVFAGEGLRAERSGVSWAILLTLLGTLASFPPRRSAILDDAEFLRKSSSEVTTTRGLFDLERCLPKKSTVYHSEIGVTGLVLSDARIVDLAGLMSRSIALTHPPFDAYCGVDRPDAVFLPHKNYVELNREIATSSCIRNYTKMVRLSSSPLYVRNDLADDFSRCARDVTEWQ